MRVAWRTEAQAVAWISNRFLFGYPANPLRSVVSGIFGLNPRRPGQKLDRAVLRDETSSRAVRAHMEVGRD